MKIRWISNETRILPDIGTAAPGSEFDIDPVKAASYIQQGLAAEVVDKPSKITTKEIP